MASLALGTLYHRTSYILRKEGWRALISRGISFVGSVLFSHGHFYIYEKELSTADEQIALQPRIDCTPKIISSPAELDDLEARGYDFRAMRFRPKLNKGAIAFCLFVGQELASVTWVAPNRQAKALIDCIPFTVDFAGGEVCSGDSFTDPSYRGKGLLGYTYCHILPYLVRCGIRRDRFSIEVSNTASRTAHARLNPRVTGRGRYLKILFWESWKEQPVGESER